MPRRAAPHDEVIEDKGVKLLIDPTAMMFLLGTEMDYRSDRMRSGFVFNNPNQTSACGCGESVTLKPAAEAARGSLEAAEDDRLAGCPASPRLTDWPGERARADDREANPAMTGEVCA